MIRVLILIAKMKIVHIITRLIVGGAQENTLLSCEGQHDRGHEVTLITGPAIGPGRIAHGAGDRSYGYRVEVIDDMRRSILPFKDWRTYRRLMRRLARDQAGCRSHAQQQGRHHRPLGGASRRRAADRPHDSRPGVHRIDAPRGE